MSTAAEQTAEPRIAAVIVTFKRRDILKNAIDAAIGQTRPPDKIVVVDNAGGDGTPEMLAEEYPDIQCVRMDDNLGIYAGQAAGIGWAHEAGYDYFWLLDDDSVPEPEALAAVFSVVSLSPNIGIASLSGGEWKRGPKRWRGKNPPDRLMNAEMNAYRADYCLLDSAVISRAAVDAAGVPRGDLFAMVDDFQYSRRIRRAGFEAVLVASNLIDRRHLGSGGNDGKGSAPPWRGYYQTRNQLAMALDDRSASDFVWWAWRQAKFMTGIILFGDRKIERLKMRFMGIRDGLTRRMGKRVGPAA